MCGLRSGRRSRLVLAGVGIVTVGITALVPITRRWADTAFRHTSRAAFHTYGAHYDRAITDLNAAITIAPGNPALYLLRAQTYLLLYEWDKVLEDCNTAIALEPAYAEAYYQRGLLYYSILQTGSSLYEDALRDFKRYLELAPTGEHAEQAGRYISEIEAQQEALEG